MPIDFNAKADDFIARVQAAKLGPSTDVVLVYHLRDVNGTLLPTFRDSIAGTIKVQGLATQAQNLGLAQSAFLATIIGNINSLVRHCPSTPFMLRGAGNVPVTVEHMELEIT
jgi:hypothetical protein